MIAQTIAYFRHLDDLYRYKYDAENRMVELRYPNDTLIASYAFDGNSLRVVKVWGADRTFYLYAGTQLTSEFEDAASNTYSAGTTPGQAPADTTTTMLYQHSDHLTTRLTTDNSGLLSNEQAHYPYGEQWFWGGTADPSVLRKFTSYQKEGEAATGKLNYAVFREHSARVGRFLMADTVRGNVGIPQRLNRYAYVMNSPSNLTDPLGRNVENPNPFTYSWLWNRFNGTGTTWDGDMVGGGGFGAGFYEATTEGMARYLAQVNKAFAWAATASGNGSEGSEGGGASGKCRSRADCSYSTTEKSWAGSLQVTSSYRVYQGCVLVGSGTPNPDNSTSCTCTWNCPDIDVQHWGDRHYIYTQVYTCSKRPKTCKERYDYWDRDGQSVHFGPALVPRAGRKNEAGGCDCGSPPSLEAGS